MKFGVELVFASFFLWKISATSPYKVEYTNCVVALKQNDSAALVTSCKIVSRLIKLDRRNDVGYTQDNN